MAVRGRGARAYEFKKPLRIEEVTFPDPGTEEVLVRMRTSGVCHTDVHALDGDWPEKPALPFIPGHEGVGVVVAAGRSVRGVKEGDRVGIPWLRAACGECEWCVGGWETVCPHAVYGGYMVNGSFADYALATASFAAHIPAEMKAIKEVIST